MKEPIRKFFIHPATWSVLCIVIFIWLWLTGTSPEDPRGYLTFIPAFIMAILSFSGALDWLTRK